MAVWVYGPSPAERETGRALGLLANHLHQLPELQSNERSGIGEEEIKFLRTTFFRLHTGVYTHTYMYIHTWMLTDRQTDSVTVSLLTNLKLFIILVYNLSGPSSPKGGLRQFWWETQHTQGFARNPGSIQVNIKTEVKTLHIESMPELNRPRPGSDCQMWCLSRKAPMSSLRKYLGTV